MGNHKMAIDDFKQAIELDKEMPEGYYRMGLCKYAQKDYQNAINDFNEAKAKEQVLDDDHRLSGAKNWGIQDGLGQAYHALKNYHKAIEHYEQAIENCPENTDFLVHRAKCYYDQGQYDLSIADLMKGLQLNENEP